MSLFLIDPRSGSGEFSKLFTAQNIPVTLEHLDFGDFAFVGNGPNGDQYSVGVERKAMGDFLQCMDDHRFIGRQLTGMLDTYHFSILLIEGIYRPDSEGYVEMLQPWENKSRGEECGTWRRLQLGRKTVPYSTLAAHLNTLRFKAGTANAGFIVDQTADKRHTTFEVAALYKWFQKPWDEHRSHIGFFDPSSTLRSGSSLLRRVAIQLPLIGYEKSAKVETHFGSVLEMAVANEETWREMPGVGKKGAELIVKAIRNK